MKIHKNSLKIKEKQGKTIKVRDFSNIFEFLFIYYHFPRTFTSGARGSVQAAHIGSGRPLGIVGTDHS